MSRDVFVSNGCLCKGTTRVGIKLAGASQYIVQSKCLKCGYAIRTSPVYTTYTEIEEAHPAFKIIFVKEQAA